MVALAAGVCGAVAGGELVPFVIPTRPVADSRIRFSFAPITVNGQRIVVRGGHFYRGRERTRIWGVNLCFGACFPTHPDAERVAERLAAAGVNSVRFHHMDRSAFPRGIWDRRDPTRLSATALDRLDYLIDRLARCGVYANINLHVSRAHSRVLGLPTARKFDKMTGIFTPKLVDAQKRYARDLLTHVNTYRKVRYADDPAVAFVEITNEDSLFMWGADQTLRSLPQYYAKILEGKYVVWLERRYGTTAKLRAAWGRGAVPLGEDMLIDGTFRKAGKAALKPDERGWRLHGHAGCEVKWAHLPKSPDAIRVEIGKADEVEWHIQLLQNRVPIKAGQYYTLSFRARADRARSISLGLQQAHEPWKGLGLWRRIQLNNTWQKLRIGFPAKGGDENAQLCFNLGGSTVAVQVADVQFRAGGMIGLAKDESLEPGTVALFRDSETAARELDRMHFLADTEKDYFDGMYRFVKNGLGCKALVTGTIVFGPLGLYAQSGMDFIDGHAYWHHPRFPGRPWDMGNWTVGQAAMADHPEQATLFRLAAERLAGKPFTVTEYNHPAPNDYQAECVPMVASFGAAQDWDGIWLFAYNHATDDWDREHFKGFFDIDANGVFFKV